MSASAHGIFRAAEVLVNVEVGSTRELEADGALTVLLKDALIRNLVQTLENNPVFIHGGPFASIAQGHAW